MAILLNKISFPHTHILARGIAFLVFSILITGNAIATPNFSNQAELSKAIGLPKDSKFYAAFFDSTEEPKKSSPPIMNRALDPAAAEDKKTAQIIRHYRGTEGQPFTPPPSREKVLAASKLKADDVKKMLDIAKDAWKLQVQVLPTPPKNMPTCMLNKTEKVAIPKTPKTQPNQLLFDYLFLQKDDLPIDPAKAFGKKTSVFEYESFESASAYLALAVKATCMPYRIRVTGKYIYRHFGLNALYNFDQQYDGKGKLDKSIAEKFKKVKK